jgi:hypothetical protein
MTMPTSSFHGLTQDHRHCPWPQSGAENITVGSERSPPGRLDLTWLVVFMYQNLTKKGFFLKPRVWLPSMQPSQTLILEFVYCAFEIPRSTILGMHTHTYLISPADMCLSRTAGGEQSEILQYLKSVSQYNFYHRKSDWFGNLPSYMQTLMQTSNLTYFDINEITFDYTFIQSKFDSIFVVP